VLQFNDGSAACGTEKLFALYGEHRGTLTVVERTAISDMLRDVRRASARARSTRRRSGSPRACPRRASRPPR
jgi:hypothetical protein